VRSFPKLAGALLVVQACAATNTTSNLLSTRTKGVRPIFRRGSFVTGRYGRAVAPVGLGRLPVPRPVQIGIRQHGASHDDEGAHWAVPPTGWAQARQGCAPTLIRSETASVAPVRSDDAVAGKTGLGNLPESRSVMGMA
jgi:hypothetical protein